MKRVHILMIGLMLAAVFTLGIGPGAMAADYEVYKFEPRIYPGMHVTFRRIVSQVVTELEWKVTVQAADFPKSVDIAWVRPKSDGSIGRPVERRTTGLDRGRTFGPIFGINDPETTEWTAPWVSREVIRELRTGGVAYNFRTGNVSLAGLFAGDLKVEEEVLYPIDLNGNRVYLPAFVTGKGQFTIWNNMENPLVLEYRPLGLPVFTGVFGWKAESISIGSGV